MFIVVGSTALKKQGVEIRPVGDIDVWVSSEDVDVSHFGKIDKKVIPEYIMRLVPTIEIDGINYATIDALYTIKCSHFQWNVFWDKTYIDILTLKDFGCYKIAELYTELVKYWKKEHGGKDFLSLNKTKDQFFTDAVDYTFDHDYLHELVAHPYKPIYNDCLVDGKEVLIDRIKFDRMSHHNKIKMFREETTVIAFERFVYPHNIHWYKAYCLALKKMIISLTKGWATDFIIDNFESIAEPDFEMFKHILTTLKPDSMMECIEGIDIDFILNNKVSEFSDDHVAYLKHIVYHVGNKLMVTPFRKIKGVYFNDSISFSTKSCSLKTKKVTVYE